MRRPPRSTRFPSTTLSRSYLYPAAAVLDALPTSLGALPVCPAGPERILLPSPAGEAFWIGFLPAPGVSADVGILAATGTGGGGGEREGTRLESHHAHLSYARFFF